MASCSQESATVSALGPLRALATRDVPSWPSSLLAAAALAAPLAGGRRGAALARTLGSLAGPRTASSLATTPAGLARLQPSHQRLLPCLPGRAGLSTGTAAAAAAEGGVAAGGLRTPLGLPQLRAGAVRRMATQQGAQQAASAASAPAAAASAAAKLLRGGRLGQAVRLQAAAAWQHWAPAAYAAAALVSVYVVWRVMYGLTGLFISVNERLAQWGLMGMAVTLVAAAGAFLRWRAAVSPGAVYRQALVKVNTHPGVLEVMGAPLVGSEVRAYVVTGGGVYLSKSMRPKLRARRIQMMFPLSGPERRGLVSLEAKRKGGKYDWRLLAVDLGPELHAVLPSGGASSLPAGPPQRLGPLPPPPPHTRVFVIGDEAAYGRSGVLGELRSPFLQALNNSRSYEVEDELEDELDELKVPEPKGQALASAAARVRRAVAAAASMLGPQGAAAAAPAAAAAADGAKAAADTAAAADQAAKAAKAAQAGADKKDAAAAAAAKAEAAAGEAAAATKAAKGAAAAEGAAGGSWWGRMRTLVSGPEAKA